MKPAADKAPVRLLDDPATGNLLKRDLRATANWNPIAFPVAAALPKFEMQVAAQEGATTFDGATELAHGMQETAAATTTAPSVASPVVASPVVASPVVASPVVASVASSSLIKIASLTIAGIGLASGITYGGVKWQQTKTAGSVSISSTASTKSNVSLAQNLPKKDEATPQSEAPLPTTHDQKLAPRKMNRIAGARSPFNKHRSKYNSTPARKHNTNPTRNRSAKSDAASLSKEADMISQARAHLSRSPAKTLQLSTSLAQQFPDGVLVQEREGLAILALYKLSRERQANKLAKVFLHKYPNGPMAERIRQQTKN